VAAERMAEETPMEIKTEIFPNPFSESFTVRLQNTAELQNAEIQMVSANGQVVFKTKFSDIEFNYTNGGALSPGTYFVTLTCNGSILSTSRIIKR
jgi:hypothetical protein